MSGVRIHHNTHRNCTLLIPHPGELKKGKKLYNKGRKPKDYYIRLDNEGNCIVSDTVLKRLKEVNANFIVLNEVPDPPSQSLSFKEGSYRSEAVYKEIDGAIKEIAPPGVRVVVNG